MPFRSNAERRARRGAAWRAAQADEDEVDVDMEVDEELGHGPMEPTGAETPGADMITGTMDESAAALAAEPTDTSLAAVGGFNMANVSEALAALVRESSRENLEALLRAADNDVGTLLEMATSGQTSQPAANVLFAAAIQRIHNFVETSWDDLFASRQESNQVHLIQWEHMRAFARRFAANETRVPAPAADIAQQGNTTTQPAANTTHASCEARFAVLEAELNTLRDTISPALRYAQNNDRTSTSNGTMDAVLDRIRQISEMREDAEIQRFEHEDAERQERVEELAVDMDELEKGVGEVQKGLKNANCRVTKVCTFMIGYLEGDITKDEFIDRLREIHHY